MIRDANVAEFTYKHGMIWWYRYTSKTGRYFYTIKYREIGVDKRTIEMYNGYDVDTAVENLHTIRDQLQA